MDSPVKIENLEVAAPEETREDRLVRLACELVDRVRQVDPARNRSWLLSLTPDDRWGLLFVLAAMVDPDVPLGQALGWTWPLADAAAEVARERYSGPPRRVA